MKTKIIALLVAAAFFVPIVSSAIFVPVVNFNIIVNAQGGDGSFPFNIKTLTYECNEAGSCYYTWQGYQSFTLETINSTASYPVSLIISEGYLIEQTQISGWKVESINCASDDLNNHFLYQPSSVKIYSPQAWSNITCIFNIAKIQNKNPVLIVPGLLGTEMEKGDELLWLNPKMVNPFNDDSFMDPLQFLSNLTPSDNRVATTDVVGSKTLGPITFDYTDGLISEFVNQGYAENETLFTFPYDWRYGVSGKFTDGTTVTDLLSQKIQDILQETGSSEVDVAAHSLGGLLVKKYAMEHPVDNHIGKAVFVGVPNTGAPKAVKVLLQGDNFNVLGLNDAEIKKIAENTPASYDLLPSQQYYNVKGDSFIQVVDRIDLFNTSVKDLNYDESKSFLINDHLLNSLALSGAENLHTQDFDNYDLRTAGVDVYSINGCKSGTISKIVETRYKDIFGGTNSVYDIRKETTGDGTVPLDSANNLSVDDGNVFFAIKPDHGKMLSQNGIRQQIVNLISGSTLNIGNNIINQYQLNANPSQCQLSGSWLWFLSPVSVEILDQNGNRSGIALDSSIQNDIPGADYQMMGDRKFVFVPTDENQTYTINIKGEDTGAFTIKNSKIINGETIQTEVFSNLPVTIQLVGQINLTEGATTLSLDTDGNGTIDEVLQPSSVVGPDESEDFLPPVSTATITGNQGEAGFYRSDVNIEIKATDDNSGILDIKYSLDGASFEKIAGVIAELTVSDEGEHTIIFFSTDNAGNNEPEKTITFTIDKTPPEAVIEFDPNIKDLKFTGKDATSVTVADNDNVIILTDQAGNTTEITLKAKNRKRIMRAEIKDLKYNGTSVNISKNLMAFLWVYDKKNNLKTLSQHVQTKKGYNILAVYNGKKTTFLGKDVKGLIIKSFNGLKIIKVTTAKGDLEWSY